MIRCGCRAPQRPAVCAALRSMTSWGYRSQTYSVGGAVALGFGLFTHEDGGTSTLITLTNHILRNCNTVGCSINTEAGQHTRIHTCSQSIASDMSQSVSSPSLVGEEAACPGEDVTQLHNGRRSAWPGSQSLGADLQTLHWSSQTNSVLNATN